MSCFVCGETASINGHHVVPQAKGGTEGPVVDLCATCHGRVHSAARIMLRGKAPDQFLSGLEDEARGRALGLSQIIVAADVRDSSNRLLSVALEDPRYMMALKLFQRDAGFSSQAKAVNGWLRGLARSYGLLEDTSTSPRKRTTIKDLRGT